MSDAPSNLHFNDTSTEDQLTIDWDEVSDADKYYLYRALSSGSTKSDYTKIAEVTSPPYTDTGLDDGERYYYRASSIIPDGVFYGFESGDTSSWNTVGSEFSTSTNRALNGTYSGFAKNGSDYVSYFASVQPWDGTEKQPSKFRYYWNDSSGGHGGGLKLRDSNGNDILGLGTDNPQWEILDGNGLSQVYGGDGYGRWVRFTVTFDWSNHTFDVDFMDLSSYSTYTDSGRPFINNVDMGEIRLVPFDNGFSNDNAFEIWYDDIEVIF